MIRRLLLIALCLLSAACGAPASLQQGANESVAAHRFVFDDGGHAAYFVLDIGVSASRPPRNLIFVVPGSGCASMGRFLPAYFSGLGRTMGATRLFILHKRFIDPNADGRNCSDAFIDADHPSRWLADQGAFIRAQLAMAHANAQPPQRVIALGISEGAEVVPQLARSMPGITHLALVANGGMNPGDSFRLQAQRYGFAGEAGQVEAVCRGAQPPARVAGRSCRYWAEMFALDHIGTLLELPIPILVTMGEADRLVPPESAHYLAARFNQAGRENFRLMLFRGADHALNRDGVSLLPYLWDAFDRWVLE